MAKQKLLESKRNVLKVRSIERNALAVGNTSNFLMEILEILTGEIDRGDALILPLKNIFCFSVTHLI